MKKILAVLVTAAAAAAMTACSSIEVATTFNNQKITDVPNERRNLGNLSV